MNKLLIFCEIFVTEQKFICSDYANYANADFSFSDNFYKRIFTLCLPRNKFLLCDLSFCSIFDISQTCKNFYHSFITPFVFCNYIIQLFKQFVKHFSKIFFRHFAQIFIHKKFTIISGFIYKYCFIKFTKKISFYSQSVHTKWTAPTKSGPRKSMNFL